MTPESLRNGAIELFGRRGWTTDLAAALKCHRTTIYRYVQGLLPIPGPVEAAVTLWIENFRRTGQRPSL
jgi:hypothetical protein